MKSQYSELTLPIAIDDCPGQPALLGNESTPGGAAQSAFDAKVRIWVSGEVVLEPKETAMQGQQFANWARSRLTEQVGFGDEPPEGYTRVTYRTLKAIPDTEW